MTLRVVIHVELQNNRCTKVYELMLLTPRSRTKKKSERNNDKVPKM